MPNIGLRPTSRALFVALALAASPATAGPPGAPAAAAAIEQPFRDWRLACAAAACALRTEVRGADGSAVLTVSATSDRGGALELRTPLPLFLPDGLTVAVGDAPPRDVPWRTCDAAGCAAETPLDPALLDGLKRERSAEVSLTLVDGVRVRLPMSLAGFTAGWEALARASPPAAFSSP
jgi:invasion protein IalB